MSKKVISILLSAAMLVAIFCVGFGALSASADDNVTYYFLAPDNYFKTEAGASNTNVGYYFWEAGGNGAWPGQAATPAPEVHPNAFKISVPNNDNVATIIFNAFVDAGSPADPDLCVPFHGLRTYGRKCGQRSARGRIHTGIPAVCDPVQTEGQKENASGRPELSAERGRK